MMLLFLKPFFLSLIFPFSGDAYRIPANEVNVNKLQGELQELLFSSPSLLRELRQLASVDDQDFDGLESEKESNGWKRSSETDKQLTLAEVSSVIKNFQSQDSLKDKDAWIGETIQFVSRILDCDVDILNPYIKKCSSMEQKLIRSGMISCTTSSNNSVGCPPCPNPSANINLQSPNYPNDYGGPWDCQYLFEAKVGEIVNLVFQEPFFVENFYDFVTICDGNTPNCQYHRESFSGYKTPRNLTRQYNKLWIKFLADDSNFALPDGKTGRWQIGVSASTLSPPTTSTTTQAPTTTSLPPFVRCTPDPGCGCCSNVTLNGGTIRSSNYPNDNQDNLNCKIVIEAASNAKVLLTFTEFVVEEDYDFVMVYDSFYRMLREKLTGYDIPVPFNVKTNNVTINFQTNANNWGIPNFGNGNTGRWALDFKIIYPTTSTIQESPAISCATELYASTVYTGSLGYTCTAECGICTNLTPTEGIIQSPNYPADYGNNRNCKIIIDTGSSNSRITLDFTEFNVEQDYDFISVFDANQKEYQNMTGYTLPDSLVLKTTQLVVQFNSDENNFGIFSNLRGRWKASFTVHPLTTTTTSTEATTTTTEEPTTTTTPTTTTVNPNMPICTSNFPSASDLCRNINLSGGIIQSPNYPNDFGDNNKFWIAIEVPTTMIIKLNFDVFVLEPTLQDSIAVSDGVNNQAPLIVSGLTGYPTTKWPSYYSTSNKMSIYFTSNVGNINIPATLRPGRWNGTFTIVDPNIPRCDTNPMGYEYLCKSITTSGGTIQSPNYPMDFGDNNNIWINIVVPADKQVRLSFDVFVLEPNQLDSITVYNGENSSAPQLTSTLSGYPTYKLPAYYSTSNKMSIKFISNVGNTNIPSANRPGRWRANFQTVVPNLPRCDTNSLSQTQIGYEYLCKSITSTGGTIESPNFPNSFPDYMDYWIILQVPAGKRIRLNFDIFVLEPNADYISVYDGPNGAAPKLAAGWSGYSTTRAAVTSTSNYLLIDIDSNLGNTGIPASYGPGRFFFTFTVL